MNSTQFYLIFYAVFVLIAGIAAYLKIIAPDIFVAGLFGVLGHAAGLFSPSPIPAPQEAPKMEFPPATGEPKP